MEMIGGGDAASGRRRGRGLVMVVVDEVRDALGGLGEGIGLAGPGRGRARRGTG